MSSFGTLLELSHIKQTDKPSIMETIKKQRIRIQKKTFQFFRWLTNKNTTNFVDIRRFIHGCNLLKKKQP
ncbi:hypothetical protein Ec53638_0414 [Escherichia coli 53638]|nr:hypothetical protein Ec53638_0414 [Escherichia coli 53638]